MTRQEQRITRLEARVARLQQDLRELRTEYRETVRGLRARIDQLERDTSPHKDYVR